MKIYHFRKEQFIARPLAEVWGFFSVPANLEQITPPGVKFQTLTDLGTMSLHNGMMIRYKLRPMMNIPLRWETEIANVEPPHRFTDIQRKGPYAIWEHTHTFRETEGGTMMTDEVKYAMPFGWLGTVLHSLTVRKQLEDIFRFREEAVSKFFGANIGR